VAIKKAGLERRRHERIPLAIPVFVRGKDSQGKEFLEFATALNFSASGALLAARRYLPCNVAVALEIPSATLPPVQLSHKAVRRMQGQVVRIATTDGHHLWAVKFKSCLVSSGASSGKVPSRQVKTFSSVARP
jgi:hypothetical protein